MKPPRPSIRALRERAGLVAILLLGLSWGLVVHANGWAQSSHFAQLRALAGGQAEIDRWHWEGMDKAWIDGHFYSVKAPGLALFSLPAYPMVDSDAVRSFAERGVSDARATPAPRWTPRADPPYAEYGYSGERALTVQRQVELNTPRVWLLALLTATLPALALLLLVRWVGDRLVPGYGTAAAVTLGLATIVMSFASLYAPHVAAATLAFAAFALLLRERERDRERVLWVGAAGLLAGLAVTFEYPAGLIGIVLFFYALGSERRLPRGAAYGAGAVLGALPVIAYNLWSLGSPFEFAYGAAVAVQGVSGHAEIGLNSEGLFGITLPRPEAALDLLLSSRGLLVLTPVLGASVAGLLALRRSRHRAELRVIAAALALLFAYNAGYWLPLGGGTPGPRFLIVGLPFVALGLAAAYRRWAAATLGLAIPSAAMMVLAALTFPLIGGNGTGLWVEHAVGGELEHTLLTLVGVSNPYLAALPVLVLIGIAVALAVRATPATPLGDVRPALALLGGWMLLATFAPAIVGDPTPPLERPAILAIIWGVGLAAAAGLSCRAYLAARSRSGERLRALEPASAESIS